MYIVKTKSGRKVAVKPKIAKPVTDVLDSDYSYEEELDNWSNHLYDLPTYEIPDFQHLPDGSELTGVREQFQNYEVRVGKWEDCSQEFCDYLPNTHRRIVLVPIEKQVAYCGPALSNVVQHFKDVEQESPKDEHLHPCKYCGEMIKGDVDFNCRNAPQQQADKGEEAINFLKWVRTDLDVHVYWDKRERSCEYKGKYYSESELYQVYKTIKQ